MTASALIERLDRVHKAGPDRWRAVCPSHESKSRTQSLAIREMPDGTVLLKCFAGCGALDVIKKVGLKPADLFAPGHHVPHEPRASGKPNHWQSTKEAVKTLRSEIQFMAIIAADIAEGKRVSEQDAERCFQSSIKIRSALEACE
jgi:hypothetical protein